MPRTHRLLAAAVVAAAAGCFGPATAPKPGAVPGSPPAAGPMKVQANGACLQLGELQQPTVTAEGMTAKVGEHLAAGRRESARRYVRRFPDVAEDLLRGCDPAKAADPAVQFVAAAHDAARGDSAWQGWLRDLPGPNKAYAAKRAEAMAHLRAGKPKPAADANLPAAAPAGLAKLDALRLHGQALLLLDKPADAAAAFGEAARLAGADAHQAAQCLLLLGESQRRAGQLAAAKATWAQAVEAAARADAAIDPGLWERAAYLKPVDAPWPDPAVRALAKIAAKRVTGAAAAGSTTPEAWVWAAAGQARADRGELHAALTAFKRAETMTADAAARDGLTVAQARTLLLLGQPKPAASVLVPVADRAASPHAPAALALLGAVKLADGAADPALTLLRRAVEGTAADWPGRAEAEADLGLAYLSAGDQAAGLRWLAAARAKFQADGDAEVLARTWENEARYWEGIGRAAEAGAARDHARAAEQDGRRAVAIR